MWLLNVSVLTEDEEEAGQHLTDFHVWGSDGFRLSLFFSFSGKPGTFLRDGVRPPKQTLTQLSSSLSSAFFFVNFKPSFEL